MRRWRLSCVGGNRRARTAGNSAGPCRGIADPTRRVRGFGRDCVAATKPRSDWNVPPKLRPAGQVPRVCDAKSEPGSQIEGDTGLCEPGLAADTYSGGKRFQKPAMSKVVLSPLILQ
ncbi:hypothetical protein MPL3356_120047 [Mesorhizobium plurifarium]|uniref:Uncharacterized protein n=1 Tax=Mesorhizobium plurifarium TaxID=69974 RepID=A0A090DG54_MESPL|nr:hypothetical protein MPL3356_120047 [Mesorhizobium plurifarium]